jgi:hypothetical protein
MTLPAALLASAVRRVIDRAALALGMLLLGLGIGFALGLLCVYRAAGG